MSIQKELFYKEFVKRESEIFPIMAKSGRRIRTKIVTIKKRAESEM